MSANDFTPYAQIHSSLAKHRKTYALARVLSCRRSRVIGMLTLLWLWALDSGDGCLDPDPVALSDIMDWDGDPYLLEKAMTSISLIDDLIDTETKERKWIIHNWERYTGNWISKREISKEQARLRQVRHRQKELLLLEAHKITNVTRDNNVTNSVTNELRLKAEAEAEAQTETVSVKVIKKDIPIKSVTEIPEWIKPELWDAFMEVRKQKKTPNTPIAIKLLINKLCKAKEDGDDPNKLLEDAIVGGWKSVVTSKERNKANGNYPSQSDKRQPEGKRYQVVNP